LNLPPDEVDGVDRTAPLVREDELVVTLEARRHPLLKQLPDKTVRNRDSPD
jgi:hypothetical protein